jgi:predicted Zn-dependent peptidase
MLRQLAALLVATCAISLLGAAPAPAPSAGVSVPVVYRTLPNGLRVVVSEDHTLPVVTVMLYYGIGFRIEPKGRTGFAHLFEHLMFQTSRDLPKLGFIKLVQGNGGELNGSTRLDFTNFFEVVPSNALEPMLWAEADRMGGLTFTTAGLKNQQDVVKSEVRVNVINAPYGGFPWLTVPQYAFSNYYNAHNFYGDLHDIDAATNADALKFYKTYYRPNNAALAIVGDVDAATALALVQKYFGKIPPAPIPKSPDVREKPQTAERHAALVDQLAPRPALALSYRLPPRETDAFYAMEVLRNLLASGTDSLLYKRLVVADRLTGSVSSSIHQLGNLYNVTGPTTLDLWLFHDADKTTAQITGAIDDEIAKVRRDGVPPELLQRVLARERSNLYDQLGNTESRADMLAAFALFDNQPQKINGIDARFAAITPELLKRTADTYLVPANRTIVEIRTKEQK